MKAILYLLGEPKVAAAIVAVCGAIFVSGELNWKCGFKAASRERSTVATQPSGMFPPHVQKVFDDVFARYVTLQGDSNAGLH